MRKLIFILLLIPSILYGQGLTYYVSNAGSDSYTTIQAQNPATPWATIAKVNAAHLLAGDNVLFKRGDTWNETLICNGGSADSHITYGAYSYGPAPIITSLQTLTSWTSYGGGIYYKAVTVESSPNILLLDGVNQPLGRYPKTGYLTADVANTTSLTDSDLPSSPDYDGGQVAKRTGQWVVERRTITHTNQTLTYSATSYDYGAAGGYIIQSHLNTLTAYGDWVYTGGRVYMYFGAEAPTSHTVRIPTRNYLAVLSSDNNVVIENINFEGANQAIISIYSSNYVTIQNNTLAYSGNYGIYESGGSDYLTVNTNIITQCNDIGVNSIGGDYYNIRYNTMSYIGYIFGMGGSSDHSYSGVEVTGNYGLITHNNITYTGYDGISFGGQNTEVSYNFINYTCLNKGDGGGIYSYRDYNTGKIVEYNIILNADGNGDSWYEGGGAPAAHGIYNDGSRSTIYRYNTCAGNYGYGIFINACKYITATYNTLYDNESQMHVLSENTVGGMGYAEGHVINNNILFARYERAYPYDWQQTCWRLTLTAGVTNLNAFGTQDYNYYCRPISDNNYIDIWPNAYDHWTIPKYRQALNLSEWQGLSTNDDHSADTPVTISADSELHFIYNNTLANKSYTLSVPMVDGKNASFSGTISLTPFTSLVLIGVGTVTEGAIPVDLPSVTTTVISSVTTSTAISGGNVTDDGGASVTARGVCWDTAKDPTISDSYTSNGVGTGSFISNITGLNDGTVYYVRAYALNSAGYSYGNEQSFETGTKSGTGSLVKHNNNSLKVGSTLIKYE